MATEEKVALHTPGPWELRGLSDHVRVEHKTGVVSRINVARCGSSKPGRSEPLTHDEVWANARLIAAAPEMLAALEQCAIACRNPSRVPDMRSVVYAAEAAIRKARGDSNG
jgi:hypothetical protein